jgi:hypothetical protein
MTQMLTTDKIGRLPVAPLSRAADTDVSICLNAEHNGKVPARAALPAATRQALTDRARGLQAYLTPCTRAEVVRDLSRVFIALACKSEDGIDAQTRALVYADVLRDLPPFAVAKACDDFCHGRAGDRKWAPTAAELKAVAESHAAPLRRERQRIERALAAEVVDEVNYREKQKVLAHARETMQQLRAAIPINEKGKVDAETAQEPEDEKGMSPAEKAEKWLKMYAAESPPLPKLSDAARRTMGLPPRSSEAA